jgi:hypothetical protein
MRRILNRILGRRTTAAPAPDEPSPYAPVWTTGAAPENDAEQFVGALRAAFAEELTGEDGAR